MPFAGGSCKQLFCQYKADCQVLSGFGIEVQKLYQSAGWALRPLSTAPQADNPSTGCVAGLVLLTQAARPGGRGLTGVT